MNTQTNIAILITCFNRIKKTSACIAMLERSEIPSATKLDYFLVDDQSPDKTGEIIKERYPFINVIYGNGSLFWAGGMRLAWKKAIESPINYDYYLLINDDVEVNTDTISRLIKNATDIHKKTNKYGILVGNTFDKTTHKHTYGGNIITKNNCRVKYKRVYSDIEVIECDLTNANILLVHSICVKEIGILDEKFKHGLADFDYSFNAKKSGFPVHSASGIHGYCTNDHENNWRRSSSIKERINYLYSPKGLAYKEYLYYIRKNFPLALPYSILTLWMKTLFPIIWMKNRKR